LPYNQNHSHSAMRILGKLGGRNRRILRFSPNLNHQNLTDIGVDIKIRFDPSSTAQNLPLDYAPALASRTLEDSSTDLFYKEHAYKFLKGCIPLLVDITNIPDELGKQVKSRLSIFTPKATNITKSTSTEQDSIMDIDQKEGRDEDVKMSN